MRFAMRAHASQIRKYTGNPYTDHLAEVAGIVATVSNSEQSIAVAWLHDVIEDQDVTFAELYHMFDAEIAGAVLLLSDLETGNRAERKAASRERLALAPGWIQTIKVADLISNTASIVEHDPKFARLYLEEKDALLRVLRSASPHLWEMARDQLEKAQEALNAPQ